MRLDLFTSRGFDRGAPRWKEALWLLANGLLLSSWLPGAAWRRALLSAFGARIGRGVIFKPGVRVKFPWRLEIGAHAWIGEDVWLDTLAPVRIGAHACLSQGVYVCTGSHDWSSESFDLVTNSVTIADHAWLGAQSCLAPGAYLEEGAVLSMAAFGRGHLAAWTIYSGNPATIRKLRPRCQGDVHRNS